MQPMINTLIVLANFLFGNLGLAIIVLTIGIRLIMLPLTLKQLRATKAMQDLQPKLAELQKKYAKDKQRLAQEQMKLYRESGMSPAGCLIPMIIQFPIWIALYQSITKVLAVSPEGFLGLSHYLYSWPTVFSALPVASKFLWLNLATPDNYLLLPILVGGTMWIQQKMVTSASPDPAQQAQARMMLWTMPLLFAFLTLQFPSGLALYWVVSNIVSIVIQYFVTGWGGLAPKSKTTTKVSKSKPLVAQVSTTSRDIEAKAEIVESARKEESDYGRTGDEREDRGGGYPARPKTIRPNPRAGRGHRPKRR
jgi:YidC/Oxa1 family membrane protein insertase